MFRLAPSICPFCEASALIRSHIVSPWQQTHSAHRGAATLQKRKPSRMSLSPNVRRGPPPAARPSGRPIRKSRNSPFGGMNLTEAPREAQAVRRQASMAEQKRADRYATTRSGSKRGPSKEKEPMKALKMQRSLASVSYEARGRVKQELLERDSFDDFDLLPVIKESVPTQALKGMLDLSPTPIQRLAIPVLLGTEDGKRRRRKEQPERREAQQYLLAAETGSGKTLAYVLPVIDALKRAELAEAELEQAQAEAAAKSAAKKKDGMSLFELPSPDLSSDADPSTARPRAIILLPTAELVAQVGALVKSLSHTIKYRCAIISAAFTSTVIRSRLFATSGVDLVISTPHLLASITESDPNLLSRVSHLVIDEADSLLDRSFAPTTSSIIDRTSPSLQQLVLCSATIPRSLDSYLHKRFPDIRRLATPNLHAIPRRVQLSVVDIDKVPFQGNRDLACAQTLWEIGKGGNEDAEGGEDKGSKEPTKIIVFVNEREKTTQLATYLRSKGIDALAFSRDTDERNQAEILAKFTGTGTFANQTPKQSETKTTVSRLPVDDDRVTSFSPNVLPGSSKQPSARPISAATSVLITTDITARGIDTLPVRHVVLYDVPHTSIDFIHRLGRVGRMGRRGRGVVLVGKNDRKDVVKEVREGMFRGRALI